jgi:hypothetical protein
MAAKVTMIKNYSSSSQSRGQGFFSNDTMYCFKKMLKYNVIKDSFEFWVIFV